MDEVESEEDRMYISKLKNIIKSNNDLLDTYTKEKCADFSK